MAFAYNKFNDMENIVKATGLTEDELANLILAKENEGWTNAEIADLLGSNFDNKEYAGKAQNELDALYSLGFNPPKDYNPTGGKRYQQWQEEKEDPSLLDRFKSWYAANKDADEQRNAAAREAIAKSVNDWRDSHPEQWRVGMVNAMFGDNSLLSQYYAAKQAAEEGEKNRQTQREYNQYLKEYDRAKLAEEKAKRDSVNQATAKAKIAELLDGYGYKTPQQREIIDLQIDQLSKEATLDTSNIELLKKQSVESAKQEAIERSQKNAKLDPLKQEIRLHGPYSSDPDWKKQSRDYIKAIQRTVGTKADGVYGKKTAAAIDKWNKEHPNEPISAPNELADVLERIDNLRWGDNKEFSPDELDELRKMVYGGEDPSLKNKQGWSDFYTDMAKQKAKENAEQRKKDKARLAELQKVIDAGYKLSATEEAEYKTLKAKAL